MCKCVNVNMSYVHIVVVQLVENRFSLQVFSSVLALCEHSQAVAVKGTKDRTNQGRGGVVDEKERKGRQNEGQRAKSIT